MFLFQHKFRIGDPVWAKMKGFSPWPGVVALPPGNNHSYFVLYCTVLNSVADPFHFDMDPDPRIRFVK